MSTKETAIEILNIRPSEVTGPVARIYFMIQKSRLHRRKKKEKKKEGGSSCNLFRLWRKDGEHWSRGIVTIKVKSRDLHAGIPDHKWDKSKARVGRKGGDSKRPR